MPYRPDPFIRLVGVSWVTGGLVAIGFRYAYGVLLGNDPNPTPSAKTQIAGKYDCIVDIPGLQPFSILGNAQEVDHLAQGGDAPALSGIQKTNPWTVNMLKKYAIWQRADPYTKDYQKVVGGGEFWVIDRWSFQLVYNHVLTARAYLWNATREEAINFFKTQVVDPSLVGVVIQQDYTGGSPHDPPLPPTDAGWAYYAQVQAMGALGHMEPSPGSTSYGREGSGVMLLNIPKLKALMPANVRSQKTFEIKFRMQSQKNVQFELFASSHDTKQQSNRNFPLDAKGWLPGGQPWSGATSGFIVSQTNPSTEQIATARIQFNPTRVLSLDLSGSSAPPTEG